MATCLFQYIILLSIYQPFFHLILFKNKFNQFNLRIEICNCIDRSFAKFLLFLYYYTWKKKKKMKKKKKIDPSIKEYIGETKGGEINFIVATDRGKALFKRGGRSGSISRTISLRLSLCTRDRGCFPEFRRLSLFSERFAFGAHARHRSSLQFAILLAIPPVAN